MRRVLVHAGFHKTGTSTVQRALRAQSGALPGWRIALERDFPDVAASARAYSVSGDPLELGLFKASLADWLESLPPAPDNLLLSCESLAGEIPGRLGRALDYRHGAELLPALSAVVRLVLGPETTIGFYLSTRAPESWLDSLHWQLSRSVGMEEMHDPFVGRMRPHADLAAQARALARAVAPDPLSFRPVEETASLSEGPLAPLCDLMGLAPGERALFCTPGKANVRPRGLDSQNGTGLADRFVKINRLRLPPEETRKRKQDLLHRLNAGKCRAQTQDNPS